MRQWNQDFLDTLSVLSFVIGMMNYDENLTQSDKDDMLQAVDRKMTAMLHRLEKDLEEQNNMLREILELLQGGL